MFPKSDATIIILTWHRWSQRARAKGQFNNIKGRGKPLVRDVAENNPFIAREEFLMNRIVKRNGAAPPWVEIQQGSYHLTLQLLTSVVAYPKLDILEMDKAVLTFRSSLQDSWTRRVIRTLTFDRAPSSIPRLLPSTVERMRDSEWEAREAKYIDLSLPLI